LAEEGREEELKNLNEDERNNDDGNDDDDDGYMGKHRGENSKNLFVIMIEREGCDFLRGRFIWF